VLIGVSEVEPYVKMLRCLTIGGWMSVGMHTFHAVTERIIFTSDANLN
jgi:hypothetical protein